MSAEMPQPIGAEGKAEGMPPDKQVILKRLIGKKFGLSDDQADPIDRCGDTSRLDGALDEILFAENAQTVIRHLV